LRIDKSFVQGVVACSEDTAIVEAGISVAQKLALEVVVEGAETAAQLEFLRGRGCDFAQGYYLSRPVSQTDLVRMLTSRAAR